MLVAPLPADVTVDTVYGETLVLVLAEDHRDSDAAQDYLEELTQYLQPRGRKRVFITYATDEHPILDDMGILLRHAPCAIAFADASEVRRGVRSDACSTVIEEFILA